MEKEYTIEHSIRGDFYRIKLTKRYKGMPGFAPDYHDIEVGTVTVKFRDKPPYFQTSMTTMSVFEIEDIKQILSLLEKGYVEEDFVKS